MSVDLEQIDLTKLIPNAIGHIAFDENKKIINCSGIGIERSKNLEEIDQLNDVEVVDNFAMIEQGPVKICIYKMEGKSIVVYSYSEN
ncbi:hypothetical protein ACO0SA_000569 [Hanseniaspora valbyensis]|uniref:Late endosomal/lysosomal adaptor and MAPK and MTOR activator 5 n=1 Tax=Hanseniaspora valbyensis NRRL Y-1626 TaxID=766949 RepID=A0A1B7TFC2_9ASCO|nr:hypothetical protein HANVADRAFT_115559 [Hanseniaspora valbyensis NRRL Y-1626]